MPLRWLDWGWKSHFQDGSFTGQQVGVGFLFLSTWISSGSRLCFFTAWRPGSKSKWPKGQEVETDSFLRSKIWKLAEHHFCILSNSYRAQIQVEESKTPPTNDRRTNKFLSHVFKLPQTSSVKLRELETWESSLPLPYSSSLYLMHHLSGLRPVGFFFFF